MEAILIRAITDTNLLVSNLLFQNGQLTWLRNNDQTEHVKHLADAHHLLLHGAGPAGRHHQQVVMLLVDDDEAIEETNHHLRSPANAQRMLRSIATLSRGGGEGNTLLPCV